MASDPNPARILVVDDEIEICHAIRQILQKEGYGVEIATSAEEALSLVESSRFDLVLTDLRLPGRDGLALLQELRSRDPDSKVILFTAFGEWDTCSKAMNAGAIDYLNKPLKKQDVVRSIRRALVAA